MLCSGDYTSTTAYACYLYVNFSLTISTMSSCGVVLLCTLAILMRSRAVLGTECSASVDGKPEMAVTVSSHQNQSGSWIYKVGFNRKGLQGTELSARTREPVMELVLTFVVTPLRPPGLDYEFFPGVGYYKFHDTVQTWPRAREICAEEGAHLAIINSEAEAEVLKTLFARFPTISGAQHNNWAWVGLYEQEGSPGVYKTIYGASINSTGFTRWSPGQPNIVGLWSNLLMDRLNGGLGDSFGQYKDAFFCEVELQ